MYVGPQSTKQKILIVEDDPIVAYKEAALLTSNGYEVVKSSTGEEAVVVFADDPEIEFILMDLDLGGGIDGAETARRILRKRSVPISFVTAHKEKEFVDRIKSIPNCGYILKSDGEYVLMNAIERGFRQFREQLEIEKRYNELCSLCERLPVITFCLDGDRKIQKSNQVAEEFLRTTLQTGNETAGLPIGSGLCCANSKDDPRGCGYGANCKHCLLREIILETMRDGRKFHKITVPMRLSVNGTEREMDFLVFTSLLSPGKDKTLLLAMENITEWVKLEKTYHLITENVTEIITITDTSYTFLYISPSNERKTGYTEEEMKNLGPKDLLTAGSYTKLQTQMKNFLPRGGENIVLELEHLCKDGSTFWAEDFVTPLVNDSGEVYAYLTTTRDITERKRLQADLTLSEDRFRLLAENARVVISRASAPDGRFEYLSPGVVDMFGCSPDALPDVRTFIETVIPEDWKERMYGKWEDLRNGTNNETIIFPVNRKSGERKWISQSFVSVTDDNGKPKAIEAIATDITELKEKELKLAELGRKNRNLLVEINHRISNNLSTVEALAQVELSVGEKSKEDSIADIISRIQAIHHIHDKLYRTDDLSEVNLPRYIGDLAETIKNTFLKHRESFRLHFEIEELQFPVKLNTPLGVITAELLTNTFKYAEFSRVCDIYLSISRDKDEISYIYRDTGTGLKGTGKTYSDLGPGTGMLLIRELISGLDGSIELHTEEGTEFRIRFPFPP